MLFRNKNTRKYKLQSKILYVNIIALIVITLLLFGTFAIYYIHENNKRFEEITNQWAKSAGNTLEQNLFFVDNIAIQVGNTPYIVETMGKLNSMEEDGNYFDREWIEKREIVRYMMPYLLKEDMIYRICIYNRNQDFLQGGASTTLEETVKYLDHSRIDTVSRQIVENSKKRTFVIYDHDVLQNNQYGTEGYIALIRPIQNSNIRSTPVLGYIEVHISLLGLTEQLEKIGIKGKIEISYQGKKFLELGEDIQQKDTFASTYQLKEGFEITIINAYGEAQRIVRATILICSILLVFIILSMILIQKRAIVRITKPIISLFQTVQQTDLESVERLRTDDSIDEIQELQRAFNNMIESLKESVDNMVVMKTEKLNAQMLALQAQIDPHFIHNTLAIITSLSEEGEHAKVKGVIQMLSSMIRYSSDYTTRVVPLKAEISNISSYLELVKYRYEEDFMFNIDMPFHCNEIMIPKFILQPIVENAIRHSLKKRDFPWEITILCSRNQDKWYILVCDNGIGIEDNRILDIKKQVADFDETDMDELINHLKIGGYSMMNTLIRMYIRYKNDMEFDIYKNNKNGTTVMLGGKVDD